MKKFQSFKLNLTVFSSSDFFGSLLNVVLHQYNKIYKLISRVQLKLSECFFHKMKVNLFLSLLEFFTERYHFIANLRKFIFKQVFENCQFLFLSCALIGLSD